MSPRSFPRDDSLLALGLAVRAIRTEKRLSQEELALRANLHVTYVSYIETGRRNLTWTTLRKISGGLETTMAELVKRAERIERQS